jgi:alpha-glucosidase
MPWHRREEWDTATLRTYGVLAALRRRHVALRRGGLRWAHVDDDALVYLREHPEETLLVAARRAAGPEVPLDLPAGDLLLSTSGDDRAFDRAVPAAEGPGLAIWRLG